jgi:hypothetical protein
MDAVFDGVLDVDPAAMSHDQRLDLLERIEHARSALDAKAQVTLALLAREGDAEARAKEWVREEVACVLSIAPTTAAARLHDAVELVERLPHTLDRLTDSSITMGHARVMIEAARDLDQATLAALEHRVWSKPSDLPIGAFRQRVKRAVLALDPRSAEHRHDDALGQRRVSMHADEHGMAGVYAYLRADAAMALMTGLDAHAAALPADGRSAEQKRADVLADLADLALAAAGTSWQGRRPAVQVSVGLSTLLGLDEQPGELDGYGPIPAAMAREIAADPSGTWRRLITDPLGRLIRYGQSTYRPPAPLRDHVIAAHKTCTFPGCRRTACRGELDHIHPFGAGGPTEEPNLHPPCKRHHRVKHQAGWTVRKRRDAVTWTSPTGRDYETPAHTYPVDHTGYHIDADGHPVNAGVPNPDPPPF